jgi:hypothetical protein
LALLLVQQAHRLADDFTRIRELAAFDFLPDAGFDVSR